VVKKIGLSVALSAFAWAAPADEAQRVVIFANAALPESVDLARHYAEKRGVPEANILALPMPAEETVTWRQFVDQVWQPAQDQLVRRGWIDAAPSDLLDAAGRRRATMHGHQISYLVVCRGVPLRIHHDPTLLTEKQAQAIPPNFATNQAAVDSELSLLALGNPEINAVLPNPLFAKDRPSALEAEAVIRVSRLDGPTPESARALVDQALAAERTGLLGRYYVDLRGPHKDGDEMLDATRRQLDELGFDGDVEDTAALFGLDARFDAPVLYFGWYAGKLNGAFSREGFRFPPGAIALHIHSYSASTVRSATEAWCGPLVARGVTATAGNVFEPYLQLTHRPNLLLRALSQGRTWGEAVYYALPALSWQAVAIGDPLYRPFAVSLDQQLAGFSALPPALAPYAVLRQARLLSARQKPDEALAALRAGQRRQPSLSVGLALAGGDATAAAQSLGFVKLLPRFSGDQWPLARRAAELLAAAGDTASALQVYRVLAREGAPSAEARAALLRDAHQLAAARGDQALLREFNEQLAALVTPKP
jgi:uncharacterized protein (TIGR03790 family)